MRLLTGSLKLNLGPLSQTVCRPLRKNTTTESKRKSLLLEVTNWPVEAKCLTVVVLSSYISVIREYTGQFSSCVSSTPMTAFPSPAFTFALKLLVYFLFICFLVIRNSSNKRRIGTAALINFSSQMRCLFE